MARIMITLLFILGLYMGQAESRPLKDNKEEITDCLIPVKETTDIVIYAYGPECNDPSFAVIVKTTKKTCTKDGVCDGGIPLITGPSGNLTIFSNQTHVWITAKPNEINLSITYNETTMKHSFFAEGSSKDGKEKVNRTFTVTDNSEKDLPPLYINQSGGFPWLEGKNEALFCGPNQAKDLVYVYGWNMDNKVLEDQTNFEIAFQPVTRQLNGHQYNCFRYNNKTGIKQNSADTKKIQVEYGPNNVTFLWNETISKLECFADCSPECEYYWTDVETGEIVSTKKIFKPIKPYTDGHNSYVCTAFNPDSQQRWPPRTKKADTWDYRSWIGAVAGVIFGCIFIAALLVALAISWIKAKDQKAKNTECVHVVTCKAQQEENGQGSTHGPVTCVSPMDSGCCSGGKIHTGVLKRSRSVPVLYQSTNYTGIQKQPVMEERRAIDSIEEPDGSLEDSIIEAAKRKSNVKREEEEESKGLLNKEESDFDSYHIVS